jgi:tripartite-type tricarboxylate transporter receptor subunit TctC
VAIVATVPNIMIVGPNIKANNVAEFIAFAKANPGKLNVGSNGVGTTLHLSGELFKLRTGIDMVHIAYKGWADCVTGLLGGQIDLMFDNLSTAMPNVVAGKTRAFAVMSPARHRLLPSVPTFDELGIRNAEVISWFGIMVPAGTPQPIIDTLGRIIRTNAETADFQDKVAKLGMDAAAMGPVESQKFWIGEVDKWEAVVRASQTPLQ